MTNLAQAGCAETQLFGRDISGKNDSNVRNSITIFAFVAAWKGPELMFTRMAACVKLSKHLFRRSSSKLAGLLP